MKIRFVISLLVITLLSLSACSKSDNEQVNTKHWAMYKEPNVFSIKHPEGWTVQFDKRHCRVKVTSKKEETIYIWPVFSSTPLNENQSELLLKKVASQLEPKLNWKMQASERNYLKLQGSNKQQTGVASLNWVSNENNSAAMCYVISAPTDYFKKDENNIVGILSSFHPVISKDNKSSQQKPKPIQFVKWRDPNEHAFTVQVPENWKVQGGLTRYTATDYRRGVNLISPDNEINVFFMDPSIPFFSIPNQISMMSGMHEGTYYTLMDGTKLLIRRYVTGANFAYEYAMNRFSNNLQDFFITKKRNRNDIARIINRELDQYNAMSMGYVHQSCTAGDVTFRGNRNGENYTGYVETATTVLAGSGSGMWLVQQLYGFSAPVSKMDEAVKIMEKLVSSFMWDPQWFMMQNKTTGNVSKIVAQTGNEMANIINESFETGQKRMDKSMREFSDYIRGTITLQDKNGERFNVWNTSNYYWADKFDDVGGTKLFKNPDLSRFRRLVEVR